MAKSSEPIANVDHAKFMETVATNVRLQGFARLAMLLTPPLIAAAVTVILFVINQNNNATAAQRTVVNAALSEQALSIDNVEDRTTVIETRINIGQANRESFQNETKALLKEIRDVSERDRVENARQIASVLAAISGITARLDAQDRMRGASR